MAEFVMPTLGADMSAGTLVAWLKKAGDSVKRGDIIAEVETVFGVIYPPQVALVGFGKMTDRPWVAEGKIVPRPIMTATLSADHRVSDGHRGGLFLAAVDRLLQDPSRL